MPTKTCTDLVLHPECDLVNNGLGVSFTRILKLLEQIFLFRLSWHLAAGFARPLCSRGLYVLLSCGITLFCRFFKPFVALSLFPFLRVVIMRCSEVSQKTRL